MDWIGPLTLLHPNTAIFLVQMIHENEPVELFTSVGDRYSLHAPRRHHRVHWGLFSAQIQILFEGISVLTSCVRTDRRGKSWCASLWLRILESRDDSKRAPGASQALGVCLDVFALRRLLDNAQASPCRQAPAKQIPGHKDARPPCCVPGRRVYLLHCP
jgi:hypothetical protein